jgi:hypothetical protein
VHVDDKTSSKEVAYDMIMGMELMTSIGITVDCEQICISAKLPQPKLRQPTDTHTSQRTLRATQVRCALARAYTELLHNMPLQHPL